MGRVEAHVRPVHRSLGSLRSLGMTVWRSLDSLRSRGMTGRRLLDSLRSLGRTAVLLPDPYRSVTTTFPPPSIDRCQVNVDAVELRASVTFSANR